MSLSIRCPHCEAEYLLPEALLGPGGARVRCPSCRESFAVLRDGTIAPIAPRGAAASEIAPRGAAGEPAPAPGAVAAPEGSKEERVARMVLDELAARSGPAIAESVAHGRPFADHGPALIAAWDEYRRRAGKGADPAPFRDALRARWGIDLPAVEDPRRES